MPCASVLCSLSHFVVADINQKLREAENRNRVLAVQKRFDETLDEELVQPHRQHIHEGVLRKKVEDDDMDWSDSLEDSETAQDEAEKGKLYCFLFNDLFLAAECIGKGTGKKLSLDGNFDLATTWVKDDSEPDCLQVVNPRSTYVFKCASVAEKETWRDSISQAVDSLLKMNRNAVERRSQVELRFDDSNQEWAAEIVATPMCCDRVDDNTEYREYVLETTQVRLWLLVACFASRAYLRSFSARTCQIHGRQRRASGQNQGYAQWKEDSHRKE